jgi:cyclopropane-fatty-acyl-phospholipid synthase
MRILPPILRRVIHAGRLTVTGPDGTTETFGGSEPGPSVAIRVTDPGLERRVLLNTELAFAEGYMEGGIEVAADKLHDLTMLFRLNKRHVNRLPGQAAVRILGGWARFLLRNAPWEARRNAAYHYDIGNDLYRLFLDEDMQYSCAYFETGTETLDEAQRAKKRHIAAKLRLEPGQRVLDIGCGWGGMALYLAQVADVEVLGITLAEEQLKLARQRAEAAGLAHKVRFELRDYRTLDQTFDRIVSVGMMEHVGAASLGTYFQVVNDRLAPDGVALIHSIMTMARPGPTSRFTTKYIFPGGYLPALSETMAAFSGARLWLLDCEILRKHYALTLEHWANRFAANRDKAREMHDERFCRMWELYLAGSRVSFLAGSLAVMQLQLGRERDAAPLTRDYLAAETARLIEREARGAARSRGLPRKRVGSI